MMNATPAATVARSDNAPWLVASSVWLVAGFVFPFLTPATMLLSEGFQRYLVSAAGMEDEMALRVAFTIFRIPLTALLAILVALIQCALMRDVRPLVRRWILAAAVGGCVATLIYLPTTLVALGIWGSTSDDTPRRLLFLSGTGLLAGLVSLLQRRTARADLVVPGWFVAANILAAGVGYFSNLELR
jgi:hypothetical protein